MAHSPLLLQLIVILGCARILGLILRFFGQPMARYASDDRPAGALRQPESPEVTDLVLKTSTLRDWLYWRSRGVVPPVNCSRACSIRWRCSARQRTKLRNADMA